MRERFGAAGAGRDCAPAALIRRGRPPSTSPLDAGLRTCQVPYVLALVEAVIFTLAGAGATLAPPSFLP